MSNHDVREQLYNDGKVGSVGEVQLPLACFGGDPDSQERIAQIQPGPE